MMRLILILVLICCAPAQSAEVQCVQQGQILDGLKAMGRSIEDISNATTVRRGVDFLNGLAGKAVSPSPDRIVFIGHNGATALIFGHHGMICQPIPISSKLARLLREAMFGGPGGEDI